MKRAITDSLLKTVRKCPRAYWVRYRRELVPIRTAIPLRWGSLAHELTGGLYELAQDHPAEVAQSRAKGHLQEIAERWVDTAVAQAEEVVESRAFVLDGDLVGETRQASEAMAQEAFEVVSYYARTQWRRDLERWLVLWVEAPFEVPLPSRNDQRHPFLVYRGRWDLVVQELETKRVLLVDHKFTSREVEGYAAELDSDTQGHAYLYAGTVLATLPVRLRRQEDRPVWPENLPPPGGFLHNIIRRSVPQEPPLLKNRKKPTLSTARSLVTTELLYWHAIKRHGLDPADYAEVLERLRLAPQEHHLRRQPNIGPVELTRWAREAVQTAQTVASIDRGGEEVAVRHSQACRQIGRRCPYIPLCHGQEETALPLFRREVAHVELIDGWEETGRETGQR